MAIDALKGASLVVETSGGRVMRYAHNTERVLGLPAQSVALLAVLMLRGAQTAGELRINCDRCTASPTSRLSKASCTSSQRAPRARTGRRAAASAGHARDALGAPALRCTGCTT
jgi:uncharacterized protein YceH (UPF0502 family)